MKKLVVKISIIIGFVTMMIGFGYLFYDKYFKIKLSFIEDTTVSLNSKVNLLSFVDILKNGKIISDDVDIDTSKTGVINAVIKVKGKFNTKEYNIDINVVDKDSPIISGRDIITIYVGNEINFDDYFKVSDNSKEKITASVTGDYDNKVGKYKLTYVAVDDAGNKATYDFVLNITDDKNNYSFVTSKGFIGEVKDGVTYVDGVLVVNKTYSLPSTYGNGLLTDTVDAFNKMKDAADKEGLNIYISSGYRSYYDQKYLYDNYVLEDGQVKADTYSARAGHSEHQTGLSFDLNTISEDFINTAEGKWVNENCYKYGFIIRYPKGKDDITGYMYECWHLRYVGVELATKLYNDGNWLTLEEYYGITSKYN